MKRLKHRYSYSNLLSTAQGGLLPTRLVTGVLKRTLQKDVTTKGGCIATSTRLMTAILNLNKKAKTSLLLLKPPFYCARRFAFYSPHDLRLPLVASVPAARPGRWGVWWGRSASTPASART